MTGLEWKQVPGFDNYVISTHGDIINTDRGVMIQALKNSTGYFRYCLTDGVKKKQMFVHRLVAQTFLKPVEGAVYVDHINRNKEDNRLENLRYVTMSQNNLNSSMRRDKKNTTTKNVHKCFNYYRWGVIIEGKKIMSKCFKTEEEAAKDLRQAAADGKLSIFLSLE